MRLDFLNKNWFRKYPLRATSSYLSTTGTAIPVSFLAAAKITTKLSHSAVYISKIYVAGNYVNVTISSGNTTLGYFSGTVTKDNTSLTMVQVVDFASGFLVIGSVDSLKQIQGSHNISQLVGRIEDSLVYCFTPPGVHSIVHDTQSAKGNVTFVLTNIQKTSIFTFGVVDLTRVLSRADKSSTGLNCPTKVIKGIGNVLPDVSGNIDVYAILPLVVTVTTGGIRITSPTLSTADICGNMNANIPILFADNNYIGYNAAGELKGVLQATVPEWKGLWPQYHI